MKIDKRTKDCVYITMGDWVVYLDNSTGERIIDTWDASSQAERTQDEKNK